LTPATQNFPFTHGEKVEVGRMAIREELNRDLKNLQAMKEQQEREKIGDQ